jgi:hypothetical protein
LERACLDRTQVPVSLGMTTAGVRRLVGTSLCVAGAFAPSSHIAQASVNYVGETAQNRLAKVRVGDDGLVEKAKLGWRAGCRKPGARFDSGTKFGPPLDESTPTHFADVGRYISTQAGDIRSRVSVAVRGDLITATEWTGTFSVRIVVHRHGDRLDRCRVRDKSWSATLDTGDRA